MVRLGSVAAILLFSAAVRAGQPLPHRIAVEVSWGTPAGPESFRARLAGELDARLASERCFKSIGPAVEGAGPDDLVLSVTLDRFLDEAEYETSLGERAAARDPAIARQVVAHASVRVAGEVRTATDPVVVRARHWLSEASWRPVVSEDPREVALERLVHEVVRSTVRFACKGSAKSRAKEITKARAR